LLSPRARKMAAADESGSGAGMRGKLSSADGAEAPMLTAPHAQGLVLHQPDR
jgi:hypothetical protein